MAQESRKWRNTGLFMAAVRARNKRSGHPSAAASAASAASAAFAAFAASALQECNQDIRHRARVSRRIAQADHGFR